MSAKADSLKSILFALAANFAIALAKGVAAFFTNSGSMLAEAIHSLADCGNQALLLWGVKDAKRPPDENHPLGYGKSIYFWSFIVALLLFSVGGLFSVYEGVHKLQSPSMMGSPWLGIGVLVFALLAESMSMAACISEVNKVRNGRNFLQWFRETRQSDLMVIFGEDLAALCGLVLALAAITLTMVTGNPLFDALGSILIGLLLLLVAWMLHLPEYCLHRQRPRPRRRHLHPVKHELQLQHQQRVCVPNSRREVRSPRTLPLSLLKAS